MTANDQEELFNSIPDGIGEFTSRHTREDEAVGVIGMDILSRLTFILSHEHKKLMLSAQPIPELMNLFT
ncbi:MAG: hypothetical protein FWB91_08205 [Defluviitaleaceae bacterium]|nr:hypothetical protein [Defluviitaleaceae bacterium]